MPTTEQWSLIALLFLLVWEQVSHSRERTKLRIERAQADAASKRRESELLDRLLEKESLSRFAQGIPVPDAVLQRVEPQSNGATPTYSGPMNAEIQETIEQMRAYGMSEAEIASELNKVRR